MTAVGITTYRTTALAVAALLIRDLRRLAQGAGQPVVVQQTVVVRVMGGSGPVRHAELAVDVREVELHRLLGDPHLTADGLVGQAAGDSAQDRDLAAGEAGCVSDGRLCRISGT